MTIGRLTWRREPSETGLARVCQSPRGAILSWNGEDVACVKWARSSLGLLTYHITTPYKWFWCARPRGRDEVIGYRNTIDSILYRTLDEAKAACLAYVRSELERAERSE